MILYLVKSTLSLILLLLVYHLVLEKEKMYRFNRGYLLFSLVFSLLIPLIPVGKVDIIPVWESNYQAKMASENPTVVLSSTDATLHSHKVSFEKSAVPDLLKVTLITYVLILLLLVVRFINKIDAIRHKTKRHLQIRYGNGVIVLLKEKTVPFSFLNYIFIHEKSYREGKVKNEILLHELTHVHQYHTLDILFVELLKILFWFNPVFYFYKKAIQLNHEFLADQAVVSHINDVSVYQFMLLESSLSEPTCSLRSNFNFTMTKKRLLMMNQNSNRVKIFAKKLMILPILAGFVLLFGCSLNEVENEEIPGRGITIEVFDSEEILLDGKKLHSTDLENQLADIARDYELKVKLKVDSDALFGVIYDVQWAVRQHSQQVEYEMYTE